MGCYTWIRTYLPETSFTDSEREFLADLRRLLPDDDAWLQMSHDERCRRQEDVHRQLQIDNETYGFHLVKQWRRNDNWYVGNPFPGLPCPPFPRLLIESPEIYRNQYRPPSAWQVAFTAPSRWIERTSVYQPLSDSRRHCNKVFWNILKLLWMDENDVKTFVDRAPPVQ
jgi:hypothetical protein